MDEADVRTIALLYEAALDRDGGIDRAGLNFWIDVYGDLTAAGSDPADALHAIAAAFLASPEFEAAFGEVDALSDGEFVERLYLNVLERPGDPAGVEFWTAQLAGPELDRADLLLAFADNPETVAAFPWVESLEEVAPGEWWFGDSAGAADLPAGPETTASIVGDGGLLVSSIDVPGDVDWVEVLLQPGMEYGFRVTGATNASLVDPAIALFAGDAGADDLPFAINEDRDRFDPAIFYRPAEAESVFLAVSGENGGTGIYRVEVTASDAIDPDPRDGPTTQYHVRLDDGSWLLSEAFGAGSVGGTDVADWYSVVLEAGSAYRATLSPAGDDVAEVRLVLRDGDGDELAATGDGADSLDFSPVGTGTYFLSVELDGAVAAYDLEVMLL